jgi:hypothetical protein
LRYSSSSSSSVTFDSWRPLYVLTTLAKQKRHTLDNQLHGTLSKQNNWMLGAVVSSNNANYKKWIENTMQGSFPQLKLHMWLEAKYP